MSEMSSSMKPNRVDEMPPPGWLRKRALVIAAVVLAGIAGVAAYTAHVVWRVRDAANAQALGPLTPLQSLPRDRPYMLFRITAVDKLHGRVGVQFLDDAKGPHYVTPLVCERVHVGAERGICLQAQRGVFTTYHALVFDRHFNVLHSQRLAGAPSRARMSSDGRLAAVTVFVTGHSYASANFSTQTSLLDAKTGRWVVEDLETLEVRRAGLPFKSADFNFWGITFTKDARRFYATLSTAGKFLLVQGDLASRVMQVIHDDVECPSLSPDNRRIGFKRRVPGGSLGRFAWQLNVLELETGKIMPLKAETRSVDDQVEWLDDKELLYALPQTQESASATTGIWAMRSDGTAPSRLLLPLTSSPAVGRMPI